MSKQFDPSVYTMWDSFVEKNPEYSPKSFVSAWHFCDKEKDANECAELVALGIKKATTASQWWFDKGFEKYPEIGELNVVTDWAGKAKAIIETTKIERVPYNQVSEEYAAIEGEGDKSLGYWKKVHWDYYTREMKEYGEAPTEDMILICEQFHTLWPAKQ